MVVETFHQFASLRKELRLREGEVAIASCTETSRQNNLSLDGQKEFVEFCLKTGHNFRSLARFINQLASSLDFDDDDDVFVADICCVLMLLLALRNGRVWRCLLCVITMIITIILFFFAIPSGRRERRD